MKPNRTPHCRLLPFILSALFLITAEISLAGNSFVKKIRVTGNTLIDPYFLDGYLDLGNGLNMTPEIMDLVASELKANYNYHGYSDIGAYSKLKVKNGVMTIKVDEKDEYRWGRPRAERAVLKQAFLHGITLKDYKKQEIIEALLKGYQKQRTIEELVAEFLVKKQRKLMEEINSQRITALREQVFEKVREFQMIKKNLGEQETRRIEEMRSRIQSGRLKKFTDLATEDQEMDEYTDLDAFLDNAMFEETLNPGL